MSVGGRQYVGSDTAYRLPPTENLYALCSMPYTGINGNSAENGMADSNSNSAW